MPSTQRILRIFITTLLLGACAHTPPDTQRPLIQSERYSEETFFSLHGLEVFARTWHPTGNARANVVILHGTALHSGVYTPVGEALSNAGYRVYAYDLQGWGRSEGKGADGYVEHFDDYAKDLYLVINRLKNRYPDTPNFVMGESLGGAVAVYSVLKRQLRVDGVITSAAGYKANPELLGLRAPGFINNINMTLAKWWGQSLPNAPILEADTGIRIVVENDALQAQLLADPDVSHSWLPAAYGSSLVEASDYIDAHLEQLKLPVLLLHGSKDMLVPVSSSQEIYDRAPSPLKRIEIYDSPHTVLLESAHTQVMQDIVSFLGEATEKQLMANQQSTF